MSKNLEQDLLLLHQLFESEPERSWRLREIAGTLNFSGRRAQRLRQALERLTRKGAIVEIRPGVFTLGQTADLITGKLVLVRSGVGFVTDITTGERVRVESDDIRTALPGDTVTVRKRVGRDKPATGRIIRIVARGCRHRRHLASFGRFLVIPFDPVYRRNIVVPRRAAPRLAPRGGARFHKWENQHVAPERIIDVIGPPTNPRSIPGRHPPVQLRAISQPR